jgi:hypothetical protein
MKESCNRAVEETTHRLTPNPYTVLRNFFVKHAKISYGEQILTKLLALSTKKQSVFKYYQSCICYFLWLGLLFCLLMLHSKITFILFQYSYL